MGVEMEQVEVQNAGWRDLLGQLRNDTDRIADRLLLRLARLPSYRGIAPEELRPSVIVTIRGLLDALRGGAAGAAVPGGCDRHRPADPAGHSGHASNGHANGSGPAPPSNGAGSAALINGNGNGHGVRMGNGHSGNGKRAAVGGRPIGRSGLDSLQEIGELRARQGVSAGDLVQGWHATCEEIVRRAREILPAGPDADRPLLQLYGLVLGRANADLVAAADGHRTAEIERSRREQHARASLVRAAFSDRLAPAALHRRAEQFRLDVTGRYHAVRARPRTPAEAAAVERYLASGDAAPGAGSGANAVLALLDDDVCGFVRHLPAGPAPAPVGVSAAVGLHELPAAFRSATRLLDAALALGRTGLIDFGTLGVDAAVATDDDVGEALLARYVQPMEGLGAAGELILDTVARYLANDGRLDTTARELHVHVNTVRYRIGRFEQVTSRSLRSSETLAEVWWALRRRGIRASRVPL